MASASVLQTYGDVGVREDVVLNSIELLTAQENQVLTMLGKTDAINMVHNYLTDTLQTAASAAVEQGQDFTFDTLTTPTRLTNLVEEIAKPFKVTRPEQRTQKYSGQNELERQMTKALKNWGNSAEFDLVRSTLVSGISGTIAKMNGLIAGISKSTNTSLFTSGTSWAASILDAVMQDNWTNSNGDVITDIFVGGVLKRITDTFTQKTNSLVNIPGGPTTIVRTVTTYETSFGTVTFHKHRYVQQAADANARVLGLNPEKLKIAYLDKPYIMDDLQRGGAYTPKAVYGSLTLEIRNQDTQFFYTGFLIG